MRVAHALVRLAAELPDPGLPTFPSICAGSGACIGWAVGRVRGLRWEHTARLVTEGTGLGYGAGFVTWLCALAIDRL
jgi:hypothetical protein